MMRNEIIVFFDGAAKGNPGPAGVGVIFFRKDGSVLQEISYFIGTKTNNQAEYEALITALKRSRDFSSSQITFYTDSELLFRQMQGRYKVRNAELKKYYQRAVKMFLAIPEAKLEFVPREENRNADLLANQAIRTHLKSQLEKE